MKEKSDKINHFLLQEQFPDIIKVAGTDKRSSNSFSSKFSSAGTGSSSATPVTSSFPKHSVSRRIVAAVDHVTQLRLESCRCPHFQEYLPRILDLTMCRMTPNQSYPRGWSFANPIHALHMVASQSGAESSKTQKQRLPPTFMYGEEHHRTTALQTDGIAEYWCSFDGNTPDTNHVIQRQMGVISSSNASVKPALKLPKDGPTSVGLPGSPSPQRSISSTQITAETLLGCTYQIFSTLNATTSLVETPPAQPITSSTERTNPAIPTKSQGSTLIGKTSHESTASLVFKIELDQKNSSTNLREGISLPRSAIDPSITSEKKSVLQSEWERPPSDLTTLNAKFNADLASRNSKIEEEKGNIKNARSEIFVPDKTVRETTKDIPSTGTTLITASKMSPANINLASATKTISETGSKMGNPIDTHSVRSKMHDISASTVGPKVVDETAAETVKKQYHTSDYLQLPGPTKEVEGSQATSADTSGSFSVPATTVKVVHCNNNELMRHKQIVTNDRMESKDEYSAVNNSSKNFQIIKEIIPASTALTIGENQTSINVSITTEKEHRSALLPSQTTSTSESQAQMKVNIAVMKEENIELGLIDSGANIDSLAHDVASNEGKTDEAHKEHFLIQRIEREKVGIKSKKELLGDSIMQNINTHPEIVHVATRMSLKDDPMEIEETTDTRYKVGKTQKEGPTSNGNNQKMVVDGLCKGLNFDQKYPQSVEADSITVSTKSHPRTTTRTATGVVVAAPIISNTNTATTMQHNKQVRPYMLATSFKSDPCMDHFRREEEKIRRARRSLTSKRVRKKLDSSVKEVIKKKRKISEKSNAIPGWKSSSMKELNIDEEEKYMDATDDANETVERWIRQFRLSHEYFWVEREKRKGFQKQQNNFSLKLDEAIEKPCCQWCAAEDEDISICRRAEYHKKASRPFIGDEVMQCLDCGFIGCSPPSLNSDTKQHMQQHLLISGHKFAVSCGEKVQLFCFECGDCVYHEIFEQEKIRIACTKKIPHMAWKEHAVLRSFDPFQFFKTPDSGILWKGLVATYPPMVPKEHFCAAQLTLRRQELFEGSSHENWILPQSNALYFAASQHLKADEERFKINAPVGIYNLGNTCFISSILQCLIFCKPLQQYFLRDSGHHYKSCEVFRHKEDVLTAAAAAAAAAVIAPTKKVSAKSKKPGNVLGVKKKTSKIESEVCLACEMDRLFLSYYGGTVGKDVFVPIEESSQHLILGHADACSYISLDEVVVPIEKGDPLIISDLLTSAWKSGGMNHLTGYDQHDAHEFLDSFLDVLGKHIVKFRKRIHSAVTKVYKENAFVPENKSEQIDIIKNMFEGSLRSVLLCENCGVKRVQQEPFMNVSLSLSEEVERTQEEKGVPKSDINVESCLQHFVLPEILGDLVYCNSCEKKTRTRKQHTFAKLPKILCLHLKRFDAAKNKKIENFVSFPSHGLNMGTLLSHWCEVTRLGSSELGKEGSIPATKPKILYDLFGTVNHIGNMQSGHYVANVKVDDTWYHCNDQHISYVKEESVLKAEGAYVLFYIRR